VAQSLKTPMPCPATASDWRTLAQQRLPRFLFDYVDGGAGDERTLAANEFAFASVQLRQRVLVDVSQVDTRAQLAGQSSSLPLALAPVGLAGMMARRGEVQAARAARDAGVPFTLSTVGICPLDEVVAATGTVPWFQLYMLRDRGAVRALLDAAWAGGCRTLVFTVDLPLPGMRAGATCATAWPPMAPRGAARGASAGAGPAGCWNVALRGKPLAPSATWRRKCPAGATSMRSRPGSRRSSTRA
jgi:L-lactate dehydrogenase (cytochrome)